MPDFLGIGAQKAGTTWLYFALAHHPEVFMPDVKEVHFWDKHYAKGYDWYERLFKENMQSGRPAALVPQSGSGSSRRSAGRSRSEYIKGEITPAYAILPPARISEIAARYPRAKLIYMVREPVARAWSAALMDFGKTGLTFEDTPDDWFLDHFHSEGSRARGDYLSCMQNWLAPFPKEQVLILDYAAIKTDPRMLLAAVAKHLEIDASFFATLHEKHLVRTRNEGSGHRIRPALKAELERMYNGKYEAFLAFVKQERLRFIS